MSDLAEIDPLDELLEASRQQAEDNAFSRYRDAYFLTLYDPTIENMREAVRTHDVLIDLLRKRGLQ